MLMRATKRGVLRAGLLLALLIPVLAAAGCSIYGYYANSRYNDPEHEAFVDGVIRRHWDQFGEMGALQDELEAQRRLMTWLLIESNSYATPSQAQASWARYAAENPAYADPVVWAACTDHALREVLLEQHPRHLEGVECDVPEDWASQ